jgi:hypothetical protein
MTRAHPKVVSCANLFAPSENRMIARDFGYAARIMRRDVHGREVAGALRGREFTDADGANSLPVMIVSQATAKKFWGDANPLGRTLTADLKTAFTVVGVVGDVRSTALNQESPALYYPMGRRVAGLMDVVVRTEGAPEALLPSLRRESA